MMIFSRNGRKCYNLHKKENFKKALKYYYKWMTIYIF